MNTQSDLKKELSDWIRCARKYANLTQVELGEKVYKSKYAISLWESGKTMPSLRDLARIVKVTRYGSPLPEWILIGKQNCGPSRMFDILPALKDGDSDCRIIF